MALSSGRRAPFEPLVVRDTVYKTKTSVHEKCSAILKRGTILDEDVPFLYALLLRHRQRDQKIGCGVSRFFVGRDHYNRPSCFWLARVDGSSTDWSFITCITPRDGKDKTIIACRELIKPQIESFKARAFAAGPVACAITGAPMPYGEAHVDHRPPTTFLTLVEHFLTTQGLTFDTVQFNPTVDGSTITVFADPALSAAWVSFHGQYAQLQITTAKANLSQGAGR